MFRPNPIVPKAGTGRVHPTCPSSLSYLGTMPGPFPAGDPWDASDGHEDSATVLAVVFAQLIQGQLQLLRTRSAWPRGLLGNPRDHAVEVDTDPT